MVVNWGVGLGDEGWFADYKDLVEIGQEPSFHL